VVERGTIRLQSSPKESWHRPSVDALFRSAALAYGRRVVGVILSGMLSDGTAGLWEIKKHGGATIVQEPRDAERPEMPQSAIANVNVDYCLGAREISTKLIELAQNRPVPPPVRGRRAARVLIVEDERVVALNLERRLRKLGYDVCGSVSSGEAALDVAVNKIPDVVLMDVHLPGISGTEVAKQIWEQLQIPVVYVTAYADTATLDKIKTTEPYGYVLKPVRPAEVDAAIQLALDRHDRENREP
jgi:chemotaxis response regulator CheB